MGLQDKLSRGWLDYGAYVLAALFVLASSILLFQKHAAFNTRTYDFARFDQAIWNTLQGRFLFSTILNHSILGNHFSPFMAFLSPVFLVWNDARALFLVQAFCVAVTGLFLYKIIRVKHTALAPWVLLAFYLNPALHDVTLFEFRRIVLAMPFLAMALYALYVRKRWLMVIGLGFALLCKEDVGFIVLMVGLYLLLFERDWKWGLPVAIVGAAWVTVVSLWVIPAFAPPAEGASVYPQLYYFEFLGDSYGEIANSLLQNPLILLRRTFGLERLKALWRVLLPLGIVLPFLAPGWAAICLPLVAYMLMGDKDVMYRLEQWYMAPVLPVLFAAIGVALGRFSNRWATSLTALLIGATLVGYALYSPAPLGGRYHASLYNVTEHHRLSARIIASVPPEASVAAQPHYVPHLSHREHIYHYPWIVIGERNTDYLLLDRQSDPYPYSRDGINERIDDLLADPRYDVELEADGIYLFRSRRNDPEPSAASTALCAVDRVADGAMRLVFVEVALADQDGIYRAASREPLEVTPGQKVRVDLYWEALAAPGAERTVSVRISDQHGMLVAQHDSLPGQGKKPTSWWQAGWQIRDVYYLTVTPQAQVGPGSLDVLVYDSSTHEVVPFGGGTEILSVCEVRIVP